MIKTVDMFFEFQNTISQPPRNPKELLMQACSNDGITIDSWRDAWIKQYAENHKLKGPFKDNSVGALFGLYEKKPVIIVGSGPSLQKNVADLKDTKGIPIISCLHNFHFLEDNGVKADFYVTLDSGPVTVEEVYEGGKLSAEEYWARTKEHTLIAYCGTHPELIKKWQGEILWYNAPIADQEIIDSHDKIEKFHLFVANGGNVLGACFYLAKAIFGGNPVVFVGADFSFSYTKKFHGWDSKYDKDLGVVFKTTDVWGHKVYTWQSYFNFKCYFDSVACRVPGLYINATEGGILGAYAEGNIAQIQQLALSDVIKMYSMFEQVRDVSENPSLDERKILFN